MKKEFVFRLLSLVTLLSIALAGLASAVLPLQPVAAQAVVPLQPQGAALAPRTGTFYPYPTGLATQAPAQDQRGVSRVAYSSDGLTLGVGTPFGAYLYDAASLQGLQVLDTGSPVTALAFSPFGDLLATGSFTDTVQIWDVQNGDLLYTLSTPQGSVNGLTFSPDGNSLATASADGAIRLWDFQSGSIIHTMRGHLGAALTVDFSPDGSLVASGGMDGSVRLWRISDGLGISSLVGSVGGVQSVKYAPDGITLGLGSGDGLVRLWQTRTGKVLLTLSGHKAGVTDLAFAPDGFSLASASLDRTVIVRQVSDGRQIRSLTGSTGAVMSVAFSPAGMALAAGAIDGAVLLFAASTFIGRVPGLAAPLCVDNAAFIADVTIPDNTLVAPGTAFTKAWRFSNTGTCTFGPGYRLAFATGDQLGAASVVPLTSLASGAIFDVSVPMVAPVIPGTYRGVWQFLNPSNVPFGPRVTVVIQVGLPPYPPYTLDISASDTDINADDSVTVRASVSGVAAAWVNGDPVINNFYSRSFSLCDDTTFTLNVVLPNGGTDSRSVTVNVNGSCDNNEADIRIINLTADDTTPAVGQTVRFSARLRNEGNSDADNFDLEWRPSGGSSFRVVVSGIDLNEDDERNVSWDFTFNSAGVFQTTARVDEDGNTDTRSLSITVGGGPIPPLLPDLVVTSFTADNTNPAAGDAVNFSAVIANQGDGPATNFRVVWRPSQTSPFQLKASGLNLQPNGSTTVNFSFTFASEGTFITELVVDDTNVVNENNEGNNARSLAITVGGTSPTPGFANVVITGLTADDTAPEVGQIVNFSVAVANQGGADAQNYQVVWRPSSSSPFEAKASGLTIPANGQTTVDFSYAFPQEGTFTTEAVVVPGQLGGAQALAAAPTNALTLDIVVGPAALAAPILTSTVQAAGVAPVVTSTVQTPEGTPAATAEPTSTGEPEGEPTEVVEPTETNEPEVEPTEVVEPTETDEPEPTAEPIPTAESTPTAEAEPPTEPTATPEPPDGQPQEGGQQEEVSTPTPTLQPEENPPQEQAESGEAEHAAEVAAEQAKKAAEQAAEAEKRAAEAAQKAAEDEARRAAEAEAAQLAAQQEAAQRAAEDEARRAAEAEAAQLAAQQEAAQRAAEDEARRAAEAEAAQLAAQQEAAQRAAEDEARRAAEAEAAQLAAQQEAAQRAAEDEARRAAEAEAAQLAAQQQAAQRAAEEEARRAAEAQAEQIKAQQEAAKQAAEQAAEAAKRAAEQERERQKNRPTPTPTPIPLPQGNDEG